MFFYAVNLKSRLTQKTEISAIELENNGYFKKAEKLRLGVSKILSKDVHKKHQSNSNIGERKAIRKTKNDTFKSIHMW